MAQTIEGALKVSARKRGITIAEYANKTKTQKWCTAGKHWNFKLEFVRDRSRHDGLSTKCKDCTRPKNPYASLKGRVSTFKGKTHTDTTKSLLSIKAKKRYESGESIPPMSGKRHTLEAKKKISKILRERSKKGSESHSYIDGRHLENKVARKSKEYKRWRFDVFSRDNFTCQKCGDNTGGNLEAHHIKPFADYPDLRLKINNGITFCKKCHKSEHKKK